MPIAAASQRGVSSLAAAAHDHRVLLTSHGRPVAVVDTAERLDEDVRKLREAARAVASLAADQAACRVQGAHSLDEVCERLGLDVGRVRNRAAQLADRRSSV